MIVSPVWTVTYALAALSHPIPQDDDVLQRLQRLEAENAELRLQVDAVASQIEQVQFSGVFPEVGDSVFGMGPAASKVYQTEQGFSFGGYGEAFYRSVSGGADSADFLRAVLYSGYKFSQQWVFNSEIEFEHASTDQGGSASVEFAYLEYQHSQALNVRAGLVLPPMGFINELHEPTTFYGTSRPEIESRIIPTTWRENGVGVHGSRGDFEYKLYLVNGFDGDGFSAAGLRGGRQKGSRAEADDLAFVGRLDWTGTPGLVAGVSAYAGDSGQSNTAIGDVSTTILDLHLQYELGPWRFRAMAVQAEVDDTDLIFADSGVVVGEEMSGTYLEAGYDLMQLLDSDCEDRLIAFARWETLDTHDAVATGLASDPSQDEEIVTVGLNWFPEDQLVFKVDYQDFDQGSDRIQVSMGYVF